MGLSRNKVAVPEGAAGTPPFWVPPADGECRASCAAVLCYGIKGEGLCHTAGLEGDPTPGLTESPIAQLVRAPH